MSIDKILDFAYKVAEDDNKVMKEYEEFENYITPIVRERFNLPRFDLQYRFMVAKEIQSFISEEERNFNFSLTEL